MGMIQRDPSIHFSDEVWIRILQCLDDEDKNNTPWEERLKDRLLMINYYQNQNNYPQAI